MKGDTDIKHTAPLVSVVLPVFNAGPYIAESVKSILEQDFRNFELIILNDGSTDNSEELVLAFKDERIKYSRHKNCGLAATLNKGINLSKGRYIARQDQDDIAYPDRLGKQVKYLEKNKNILLLGCRARIFSEDANENRTHDHATEPAVLKFDLMFDNPFVHSTVMFRKADLEKVGPYNTDRSTYEDYELWSRFAIQGDVANLREVLLDYRHHDKGMSKNTANFKEHAVFVQSLHNIETFMGEKNKAYNDLSALYHWHPENCRGVSLNELDQALERMAAKVATQYPGKRAIIAKRMAQYKKIIRYRINVIKLGTMKKKSLGSYLLKIQNRVLGLHPNVINE